MVKEIGEVTPSALKHILEACIKHNVRIPHAIYGPPGIGKSDIVKETAERLGIGMIDRRLAQYEAPEIRGIPDIDRNRNRAVFVPSAFIPDVSRDGERGILFLDEITNAPSAVQNAALELLRDYRIGDAKLPDGWTIVAAGNRIEDGAFVNKLSTALRNRLIQHTIVLSVDDWIEWAVNKLTHGEIISYIHQNNPDLLNFEKDDKVFPSPRSWEFVDKILGMENDLSANELSYEISGAVGQAAALRFVAFKNESLVLPNIQEIMAGKNVFPSKPPQRYSVIYSLSTIMAQSKTKENYKSTVERLVDYALYLIEVDGGVEYSALLTKNMTRIDKNTLVSLMASNNSKAKKLFGTHFNMIRGVDSFEVK